MNVPSSKLKAHLGHYLRVVRKGRTITVTDRDEAVATLAPLAASKEEQFDPSEVREAGAPPLGKISIRPVASRGRGSLDWLREDRDR